MKSSRVSARIKLAIPWLLWGIWKHRNNFLFEKQQGDINVLVNNAFDDSDLWNKEKVKENLELRFNSSIGSRLETRWFWPREGLLKCNLHANWLNSSSMIGGAWLVRDSGEVGFYAREAFLPSPSRIEADFQVIEWVLQSLSDLHIQEMEVWCDSYAVIEVLSDVRKWPIFRSVIYRINSLVGLFRYLRFQIFHFKAIHWHKILLVMLLEMVVWGFIYWLVVQLGYSRLLRKKGSCHLFRFWYYVLICFFVGSLNFWI